MFIVTLEGVMELDTCEAVSEDQVVGRKDGHLVCMTKFGNKPDSLVTILMDGEEGYNVYRGNNLNTILAATAEEAEAMYIQLTSLVTFIKACEIVKGTEDEE